MWLPAVLILLAACTPRVSPPSQPTARIVSVSWESLGGFQDDMNLKGLEHALVQSLRYCERSNPRATSFQVDGHTVSLEHMEQTVRLLLKRLREDELSPDALSRDFQLYAYQDPAQPRHNVLLTGYYEPVLEARLQPDPVFRYPLYGPPSDLVQVAMERFPWLQPPSSGPRRLLGRIQGNRLVPYFDRRQIDGQGALKGRGLELAWLKDPVDAFILHVQGSGVLKLADGTTRRIGYAGTNGHPYRSIGAYVIAQGWIPRDQMSLSSLRRFLRDHPERLHEILFHNPSYIFFRWVDEGPLGSLHVPLTPGRSVAADSTYFPDAVPGLLLGRIPLGDGSPRTRPFQRWVVHQDSGGAIRGPHRLDLYCGTGPKAEAVAGRLKHPATLYIVLKKMGPPADEPH
ncbi:membrane-bound lytic murein transglycosylase A [Desulfacinum hydrothermale DSM 13146]|uniref:peptidoglycan lytic exotransglycosylase n=1 Tax=Desulfacinum hydrothermale DSM 13146 TaxID=1121390 RepID=A0A1W1XUQ2_9BACT|nr:MltA domain-containing protein [Desulfacinum hydrothermale]SMC27627.1 membrane-bound lytic murein transglycosylase A [Desulfacinum hydrothermale DSM 13146]